MTLNFKTAALALTVAAAASTAQAADFNNSGVDFANVDRWTGAYAGGHIGTGSSNQKGSKNKINGGVQVGYNQQFGDFVVGGEIEAARAGGLQYQVGKGGALQQTWSGTARAKAGYALDNVLLYGTVGVTTARFEGKGTVTSRDRWHTGWTYGAGAEMGFTENISGKVEYTQTRFNGMDSTIGGVKGSNNLVNHAIKTGLNFRF
ncbi:outer membrane protein [Ensifer adhaerens]|uniref:outer membrane protein n=1 Tax=Ensifer adhaerens TaxID=106592 RepID=UPI000DC337DF|nr:outer membrane protein [Ensifer adhaerens]RAS01214.1 outer membrane immunogenic protein [Ensifer adhaerens]